MKALLVTDAATNISIAAYRCDELGGNLTADAILNRAGISPQGQTRYVGVIRLDTHEHTLDPHAWGDPSMRAAHLWLRDHFEDEPHGGAVDVQPFREEMANCHPDSGSPGGVVRRDLAA